MRGMVLLFVIISCYLLRVVPNSMKTALAAGWGFCWFTFVLMITEVITINSVELVKSITIIAIGGVGTMIYALRESSIYNRRRAKLLHRWKNEVTLENAA